MIWSELLLQLIVPTALIASLAFGSGSSRVVWLSQALLTGVYLAAIAVAGVWLIVPYPAMFAFFAAYVMALATGRPQARQITREKLSWRRRAALGLRGVLTLAVAAILIAGLLGHRAPSASVDLSFPLADGTYSVANGGSTRWVNAHLETLDNARLEGYRGQSFGVDLIELNAFAVRARGLRPKDPRNYRIFGDTVFAPCMGRVVFAVDGLPDQQVPVHDRKHMAGNHVVVDCNGVWVLLGHLRNGSLMVRNGELVLLGQPLGAVGNSGNSDEPHLHIHAQRPGRPDAPFSGEPLPIRLDGRYLARNAQVVRN